jgi:hypothetical protein
MQAERNLKYDAGVAPLTQPCSLADATHRAVHQGHRVRFILPRNSAARRAAVNFFAAGLRGRLTVGALSVVAAVRGAEPRCSAALLDEILARLGADGGTYAIANGTPGPWTKSTILLMDAGHRPVVVVKLGATQAAGKLIAGEAQWLTELAAHPRLAPAVPRLLGFDRSDHVTWLAQEPVFGRPGSRQLGNDQLGFLELLQSEMPATRGFAGSVMQLEMRGCLERRKSSMTAEWRERLERAFEFVQSHLPGDLAMTAAHRDFAHWNIRRGRAGILVFDWEYARAGYVPLYDPMHFLLMPSVLAASLTPRHVVRAIGSLPPRLGPQDFASRAVQCLAYLVDVCLMFIDANQGEAIGPVVRRYAVLIDQFSAWRDV